RQEFDVEFDRPASLDLVLDHYDTVAASASVTVERAEGLDSGFPYSRSWSTSEQPDASGHCTLTGFQPGSSRIELSWVPRCGGEKRTSRSSLMPREWASTQAQIDLPAFHELTVSGIRPLFGSPIEVTATSVDHPDWKVTATEESEPPHCVFDSPPAGIYDVTV